jgi:hypothetical protein
MSQQAEDLMRERMTENVSAEGYPAEAGADPNAEALVQRCLINAQAVGLTEQDLVAQFGDLRSLMQEALVRASEDQRLA